MAACAHITRAKKAEESPQLHDIQIESEGLVKEVRALGLLQDPAAPGAALSGGLWGLVRRFQL